MTTEETAKHLPFHKDQNWGEGTFSADEIWQQIEESLRQVGLKIPTTPRRPDVRMILNNASGRDIKFHNPAKHSNQQETIGSSGDKTAAMVMLKGNDLEEQHANAKKVYDRFDLGSKGLSSEFIAALEAGELSELVDEAYGPAPFEKQADQIQAPLIWRDAEGSEAVILKSKGLAGVFGARAATDETVFQVDIPIRIQGTGTVPEFMESFGIYVAVSKHWKTGEISTRPIAPSVARDFYGEHYEDIPSAVLNEDGQVQSINLHDGNIINVQRVIKAELTPSSSAYKPAVTAGASVTAPNP